MGCGASFAAGRSPLTRRLGAEKPGPGWRGRTFPHQCRQPQEAAAQHTLWEAQPPADTSVFFHYARVGTTTMIEPWGAR